MTPCDLVAIQARAEAATPGPWRVCGRDRVEGCTCGLIWSIPADSVVSVSHYHGRWAELDEGLTLEQMHRNSAFIEASREDIPALVAEVSALRARVKEQDERGWEIDSKLRAAEARVKKLREALRWALDSAPDSMGFTDTPHPRHAAARALLETNE